MAGRTALIGHTGFVGGNLLRQTAFDDHYNTSNLEDLRGRSYDLIVSAGAPAVKWLANKEPEADRASIQRLMDSLAEVRAARFILISTIDVYPDTVGHDESADIALDTVAPYGRHRLELERFVLGRFAHATAVRLPALFGPGLKKNVLYDLLHQPDFLQGMDRRSTFQYYDLDRLWPDLQVLLPLDLPLVNFVTQPVSVERIAAEGFGVDFTNELAAEPICYDLRSQHAERFGGAGGYFEPAERVLERIARFVTAERARLSA